MAKQTLIGLLVRQGSLGVIKAHRGSSSKTLNNGTQTLSYTRNTNRVEQHTNKKKQKQDIHTQSRKNPPNKPRHDLSLSLLSFTLPSLTRIRRFACLDLLIDFSSKPS